jgi:hypothetical protein
VEVRVPHLVLSPLPSCIMGQQLSRFSRRSKNTVAFILFFSCCSDRPFAVYTLFRDVRTILMQPDILHETVIQYFIENVFYDFCGTLNNHNENIL